MKPIEIAEKLGKARSTIHSLLSKMVREKVLRKIGDNCYMLATEEVSSEEEKAFEEEFYEQEMFDADEDM